MFCSNEFMYQMPPAAHHPTDYQHHQASFDINCATSEAAAAGYQNTNTSNNLLTHYQQQDHQNEMAMYNDRPSPSFRIDDILVQKGHPYAMYPNSGQFGQYGPFHQDKEYQGTESILYMN